jgi:N-carbamoyl-L-amino-acid hydrolase
MKALPLAINADRLMARISALAEVGSIEGGGVCRLALTEEDRLGRDRVVGWMREQSLDVTVDAIGNVVGVRAGLEDLTPVMTGSHIDTVRTGGRYDGNLGVLAGLEVLRTLDDAGVTTRRPLAVAFFTNEEGARFAPDMMGSMVHQGHLDLDEMLTVTGIDGVTVGHCLDQIGYTGSVACPASAPHAFVELHVEQGPVLERNGITIGAVTGVQGISWTEVTLDGVSNHAGTTPMAMRCDAGLGAARIAAFVRDLALEMGEDQVGTVGAITLEPNLVNVIARRATLTVDLRNTSSALLAQAEARLAQMLTDLGAAESLTVNTRTLARFEPVDFAPQVIKLVEEHARALGASVRQLPSGAGHDAQSFAPNCPTGMIFVPSAGGISHNVAEHTDVADIAIGANVLLRCLTALAA